VVLIVVVDTSTPAITAAVVMVDPNAAGRSGVEHLSARRAVDSRAHGELLAPAVAEALSDAGASGRDLAAIVAGLGPGPFTGLRAGLMTAAAMGQALAIPTYGVCSLDAIGTLARAITLVATDARRREIYWGVYRGGVALTEPAVDRPERVAQLLKGSGVELAVGDGALLYASVLALPVHDEPRYPPPIGLAELAAERVRRRAQGEVLTPLYLRRPDAAEPKPSKAVTR
ncbi:MAG: tRNA (adenosine(37)-N6)-threonylcarbamoyltransferase complex dimerization subunit type 1 TsaB, partial [Sporichthyaceae bacterium]|nr:tRNA (adenosine(37)-N6)-threonylcarbamoyltransferase complex dimerization subunit type 1 TsaB [Sporichthyaceae bacterium]